MKKNIYLVLGTLLMFFGMVISADAFFVQDVGQAFSYNNIARDGGGFTPSESQSYDGIIMVDDEVNYADIADKMLVSPKPFPNINMTAKSGIKINMKAGQSVKVELPEIKGSSWKYDSSKNNIKVINSELKNGLRILEFKALAPCECKVYLDNYQKQDKQLKVLQSKILRFNIRKK